MRAPAGMGSALSGFFIQRARWRQPAHGREDDSMKTHRLSPVGVLAVAALFSIAVARPALAAEDSGSRFPPPPTTDQKSQKPQKGQQGQKKKKQNQGELR